MINITQTQIDTQVKFAEYESQIQELRKLIPMVLTHPNPELSIEELQDRTKKAVDYLIKISTEYGRNQEIYDEWANKSGRQEFISQL